MTSIRGLLLRRVAAGSALAALASGVLVYAIASHGLKRQFDESLLARARDFASLVILETADPEEGDPGGLVFDYKGPLDAARLGMLVRVRTPDGDVLAATPLWPEPVTSGLSKDQDARWVRLPQGVWRFARLTTTVRAEDPDDDEAPVIQTSERIVVEVLASGDGLHRARGVALAAAVAGAALAGALMWFVTRVAVDRGLRPLRALASELERTPPESLRPIASDASTPVELRPISEALNGLLSRVGRMVTRERRFTDAAAHELRTPIAELRSVCDVASRHPTPERLERAVREAGDVGREMTLLMEALLQATGRQSVDDPESRSPSVKALAQSLAARHAESLAARDVALRVAGDDDLTWDAPAGAVLMITRNLIDNASAYTPDGGSIDVTVRRDGDACVLEVSNHPVGLSGEDATRIFEPFWRADDARSDRAHRGLGLAIVAAQCDTWDLTHKANLTGDGVLTISVRG